MVSRWGTQLKLRIEVNSKKKQQLNRATGGVQRELLPWRRFPNEKEGGLLKVGTFSGYLEWSTYHPGARLLRFGRRTIRRRRGSPRGTSSGPCPPLPCNEKHTECRPLSQWRDISQGPTLQLTHFIPIPSFQPSTRSALPSSSPHSGTGQLGSGDGRQLGVNQTYHQLF